MVNVTGKIKSNLSDRIWNIYIEPRPFIMIYLLIVTEQIKHFMIKNWWNILKSNNSGIIGKTVQKSNNIYIKAQSDGPIIQQ